MIGICRISVQRWCQCRPCFDSGMAQLARRRKTERGLGGGRGGRGATRQRRERGRRKEGWREGDHSLEPSADAIPARLREIRPPGSSRRRPDAATGISPTGISGVSGTVMSGVSGHGTVTSGISGVSGHETSGISGVSGHPGYPGQPGDEGFPDILHARDIWGFRTSCTQAAGRRVSSSDHAL